MREYECREIWRDKCPVCGCRNKIHTELVDPLENKLVGYTLKCCACGDYHVFFNEHDTNGVQGTPNFIYGKQRCLQPSFCPHKDCKLYGVHGGKEPDVQPKPPIPDEKPPYIGKVVYNYINDPKFL